MKKKNAFTLIELLAIIVILAIIAVITVPIILNIIENSKKGATIDSAYGYKDAVQKYYLSKTVTNPDQELPTGTYNITDLPSDFKVSGEAPIDGWVQLEKGQVVAYSLKFDNYVVTKDRDSEPVATRTGEPTPINNNSSGNNGGSNNNENNSGSSGNNGGQSSSVPTMAEMCPGCKFIYTTSHYSAMGTCAMPSSATDDYTDWTSGENSHPYFLGLIESTTSSGIIGRVFACGIENGTPFCLEGYDPSKYSDDDNVGVLNTIFPSCNASASDSDAYCNGTSVIAYARAYGDVDVHDDYGTCVVDDNGDAYCDEY